jgi:phytoene dehydrogenase-like protein
VRSYPLLIIGGGLSGLAAGIRFARFGHKVLILEKHSKAGGLNSYYYRKGRLLETGLHAITNYASPDDRHAPLNLLLRQLKIPRRALKLQEQLISEILFPGRRSLRFSNDFNLLQKEVGKHFPDSARQFAQMVAEIDAYDPFTPRPKISARRFVSSFLQDNLLVEMLFCPIMFYGSSEEDDVDLSQFVILFRSIFQEGLFRPTGTIKDILDLLLQQYSDFGGEIEFSSGVIEILTEGNTVSGVRTDTGEVIGCEHLVSTAGLPETRRLFPPPGSGTYSSELTEDDSSGHLSFFETICLYDKSICQHLPHERTIIFYNLHETFSYRRPGDAVDINSGVICFPGNFQGRPRQDIIQMRVTHLANYEIWRNIYNDEDKILYPAEKKLWAERSREVLAKMIGNCDENIVYEDSFTPVTIERFTSRAQGAVYGSPHKVKDGRTRFANLYIAGTDQGYLGIVGSLLSGVTMVNQNILNKI